MNIAIGGYNRYELPSDNIEEIQQYLAEIWGMDRNRISICRINEI